MEGGLCVCKVFLDALKLNKALEMQKESFRDWAVPVPGIVELGFMWTAELELHAGRRKRLVLRGLGPGEQSGRTGPATDSGQTECSSLESRTFDR
eukprot:27008-Amphidinium_carterae.2